jgi:hypothetical protein
MDGDWRRCRAARLVDKSDEEKDGGEQLLRRRRRLHSAVAGLLLLLKTAAQVGGVCGGKVGTEIGSSPVYASNELLRVQRIF